MGMGFPQHLLLPGGAAAKRRCAGEGGQPLAVFSLVGFRPTTKLLSRCVTK